MNNQDDFLFEDELGLTAPSSVRLLRGRIMLIIFGLLVIVGAGYLFKNLVFNGSANKSSQEFGQAKADKIVAELEMVMELPANEKPTVATVEDLEPLAGQAFFAKAKLGDIVIIYTGARKAILYDYERKKILEVAPLVIGDSL